LRRTLKDLTVEVDDFLAIAIVPDFLNYLDNALQRGEHFMMDAQAQELQHFVVRSQFRVFGEAAHITAGH